MTGLSAEYRFQLPDNWTVEDTVCVVVRVPDDPQYIAQLTGLLDALKFSKNFGRDASRTGAATVSRTWQQALESAPIELRDCDDMQVRQNAASPCTLEQSTDGGETWSPFADLTKCPPLITIDPATGNPLWFNIDNGPYGTWEILPLTDAIPPDAPTPTAPPFPAGSDEYEAGNGACAAAANIVGALESTMYQLCVDHPTALDHVAAITLVVGGVLLFVFGGFLIELGIVLLATGLLIEEEIVAEAFSEFNWTDIRDNLACYLNADGSLSAENKDTFREWLAAEYPDNPANTILLTIWDFCDPARIQAQGKIPQDLLDADCTDAPCDWSHTFDFTLSDGGFDGSGIGINDPYGIYEDGVGWHNRSGGAGELQIWRSIPSRYITEVTATGYSDAGEPTFGAINQAWTVGYDLPHSMDEVMDRIRITMQGLAYGTDYTLTSVTINGLGTNPFG